MFIRPKNWKSARPAEAKNKAGSLPLNIMIDVLPISRRKISIHHIYSLTLFYPFSLIS